MDAIQGTERPRGREKPDTVANCEELSSDVLRIAPHFSHGLSKKRAFTKRPFEFGQGWYGSAGASRLRSLVCKRGQLARRRGDITSSWSGASVPNCKMHT